MKGLVLGVDQCRVSEWGTLPDSLIRKPSSIALVISVVVGGLQLGRGGDGRTVLDAGCLRLLKRQGVAGRDGSVVEHDACKIRRVS